MSIVITNARVLGALEQQSIVTSKIFGRVALARMPLVTSNAIVSVALERMPDVAPQKRRIFIRKTEGFPLSPA
jgi:hypothetical protein